MPRRRSARRQGAVQTFRNAGPPDEFRCNYDEGSGDFEVTRPDEWRGRFLRNLVDIQGDPVVTEDRLVLAYREHGGPALGNRDPEQFRCRRVVTRPGAAPLAEDYLCTYRRQGDNEDIPFLLSEAVLVAYVDDNGNLNGESGILPPRHYAD
jgi:hypothetical protein